MPTSFARIALALFVVATASVHVLQSPTREIAVTIDDLPIASGAFADDVPAQSTITARLLASLTRHHVPAIGFVNEEKLAPHGHVEPARVALLQQWIDGGFELGNHTYSHPDFAETSLHAYESDVAYGDSVTRALLMNARRSEPMWFRHPFLSTGKDSVTRARFEHWLAERGYRVAPVTVNNNEYIFAAAYERLVARHDSVGMRHVAAEYVTYMSEVMGYYERMSKSLFGRDIRQVLLIHANVLNADHFDDLAAMFQARGYTFVSLAHAVEDSAYRSADTYNGPSGFSWIHRWAMARGKPRSFYSGSPGVPVDVKQIIAQRRTGHG
jgi:peptidoglycan/xylan/chitin deacetylase (PgdA/CDA1 family)